MGWWSGKKGKYKQISTLTEDQQPLQSELVNAGKGNFGDAADYYRNLLSNDSADMQAFAAPELRRFKEDTIPDLSNQFAGMGAGDSGLTGSSFRNAAVNAGTDLSERLGSIRANLRQAGAQGLQDIGNQGLKPVVENVYEPGTEGFGTKATSALLDAGLNYATGGTSGMIKMGMNAAKNAFGDNKVGKNTNPYGGAQASQTGGSMIRR